MGGVVEAISDLGESAVDTVKDVGKSVDETVRDVVPGGWTGAALLAAGAYYAPEIGAWLDSSGAVVPGSAGVAPEAGAGGVNLFADGAIPGNAAELAGYGAAGAGAAAAGAGIGAGAGAAAGALGAGALGGYAVPGAILASSLLGANAAKSAAATQAAATDRANQIALQMFQEQKKLQEPYVTGGVTAQNRLLTLLGLPGGDTTAADYGSANKAFTPSDLTTDPSYQFRLTEGLKALDRQAAARGGLISGQAIKAAQTFGQNEASQEYQNAFARYQTNRSNMLQPLGNLVTSGQNAAANTGSAAANYGSTAGSNITSGAAATAAGNVGAANALTGGVSQYLNYNTNNNLLNMLAQQRQSAYGAS